MLMVTVSNRITTEFYGRSVHGSYVIENEMITVKTARGQKAAQLGGSKPHHWQSGCCASWQPKARGNARKADQLPARS